MKRAIATALVTLAACGLVIGRASSGGDKKDEQTENVRTVEKEGLKIGIVFNQMFLQIFKI